MADEEIKEGEAPREKTFWGKISLWQKIVIGILIITFIIIVWSFLFGGINSIFEFVFVIFVSIVLIGIGYVVVVAGEIYFKEDYFTRLVNLAVDFRPENLNNLWFEGDVGKKSVSAGRILGCIGIPYLIGTPKRDESGAPVYVRSKILKQDIPVFAKIESAGDGDTLFVYEKGWFIFKRRHFLRCNRALHSTLNGDVTIYDINPVPYGKYFEYPYKQYQQETGKIMLQSQLEVILATHEHQGDLISQSADAGIYFNPYFKLMDKMKAEVDRD